MPITLATHAMGTRFELVLAGAAEERLRPAGEAALREVEACHARFNLFDPGSWLSTINRRAADEPVALDDETFELLSACVQVYRASGGAFDVTVAPLMRALGFHGEADPAQLDPARACVSMDHVELDGDRRTVRFTRPGVTLDLGGIAKGFAIDRAVETLCDCGVGCALLHGGTSTVAAIGAPPGEDGWRVSLKGGEAPDHETMPVVCLEDEAMSLSAPHGRTVRSGTMTLGHVLDPRVGRPAQSGAYAAAVGPSACLTDAWATALLVLGVAPDTMPHGMRTILPDVEDRGPSSQDSLSQQLEAILK
jgi:thiamine biosynthesis lipoprotein